MRSGLGRAGAFTGANSAQAQKGFVTFRLLAHGSTVPDVLEMSSAAAGRDAWDMMSKAGQTVKDKRRGQDRPTRKLRF